MRVQTLAGVADKIKNFAIIYLVDINEVRARDERATALDARALGTRRLTAGLGARRFRTLMRCTNCTIRAR